MFRSDRMAAITSLEVIQTADVTNDIVLQCSSCRAIVGDTRDYVCTIRINEVLYIVLSGEWTQGQHMKLYSSMLTAFFFFCCHFRDDFSSD